MSDDKPKKATATDCWIAFAVSIPASMWTAYAISRMYLWIVAPGLGLPGVGWLTWYGVIVLFQSLQATLFPKDTDTKAGIVGRVVARSVAIGLMLLCVRLAMWIGGAA